MGNVSSTGVARAVRDCIAQFSSQAQPAGVPNKQPQQKDPTQQDGLAPARPVVTGRIPTPGTAGIEAAAVTGIILERTSVIVPRQEVIFDRPFLFAIVDDRSKAVMLSGVYAGDS